MEVADSDVNREAGGRLFRDSSSGTESDEVPEQLSGLFLNRSDCIYRCGSRYSTGAHKRQPLYCRTPGGRLEKGVQFFGSFLEGLRGDCLGCGGDFLAATGISTTFREAA